MPVLIRCDSWDHYNTVLQKWDFTGNDNQIDLTGTKSRTGIGCLLILSAAFGPRANFTQRTTVTCGTAFFSNTSTPGDIIRFIYAPTAAMNVRVGLLADGSLRIITGNDGGVAQSVIGTTAGGVFQFSTYNYIECQVFCATAAAGGFVVLRCNGVEVLNIQNVQAFANVNIDNGAPFISQIQLMGPGGIADLRHDDTYIADWSTTPAVPFYGAVGIYARIPTADTAPLNWTPNAGVTHYTQVDEIPPNGDTDYVFDAAPGNVDQYSYDSAGLPVNGQIQAIQHVLSMEIDAAGSRSVASVLNGAVNPVSFALTTAYKMYLTPYDINPATGQPWDGTLDFPASFGPGTVA